MEDKTILVIEDSEMNMRLMRAILKVGNYTMLEAMDAETGLCLVREHHPDLILMDIQLPGMDGLSATKILKSDPDLKDIPVFALTGSTMASDIEEAADAWFAGYIVKPFSVSVLLETIKNYFNRH